MKTTITNRIIILCFTLAGFVLFSGNSFAQKKTEDLEKGKKTVTIHVTKEENGNVVVIDTTVVTDGDFDADAFLAEKGISSDITENNKSVEKKIVILNPGKEEFEWSESNGNGTDTLFIDGDKIIVFNGEAAMEGFPSMPEMPFEFHQFDMPHGFPGMSERQVERMIEGMARSCGLGDVMPFGDMKQMVIKKKRNGKKVIITFEDRDEDDMERKQANQERVIIIHDDKGNGSQVEKHVIIKGNPGEKVTINKENNPETNVVKVTVDVDTDKTEPEKTEKKVIIIKEEKKK